MATRPSCAAVAAGESPAIAVYDLSRLARNARLMLDLQHELERRAVPLLVANLPGAASMGPPGATCSASYVWRLSCSAISTPSA